MIYNQDPLFVDAAMGDLNLKPGSPAIDAGNDGANTTTTDMAGNPRIYGAYEALSKFPPGWTSSSGSVGCGSEADYETATGVWTLTGFNCYYTTAYTTDALAFVQRSLCGDGSITAQITSLNGAGWAGVIMRESNAVGAKKAQLMTNLSSLHRREFRTATGGQAYPQQFPSNQRFWLRLVRQGSQFSGYVSPNGVNWYFIMAQQIAMSPCIEIGLVVTNNMPGSTVTATFANVGHDGGATAFSAPEEAPQLAQAPLEFSLYPNPTSGELNLEWSAYAGRPVRIEVLSAQGQLLTFAELDEVNTSIGQLDISRYPDGVYIVRIQSEGLPDASKRVVLNK